MTGDEPVHPDCGSNAGKTVRCDRCRREYVCTPSDDYYCTPAGDHCCEPCLLAGAGIPADRVHMIPWPSDGTP